MAKAKTENRKDAAQTAPEAEQAMEQTTGQAALEATQAAQQVPPAPDAARDGGAPRSGSEAFSAQNASDSPSPTGCGGGRHPEEEPNGLQSLAVLADRHRVPAWQHAALLRLTGWADDKQVTEADYQKALDNLKVRRIGGGRG